MARARPHSAAATTAGLRALSELVLAVLRGDAPAAGFTPALASVGAPALAPVGTRVLASIGAPPPSTPMHSLASHAMASEAATLAGTGQVRDPAAVDVEAEHAEIWQLVAQAQAGDGEAFGQLYDRYVDTVYRYVYFRVGDRALAEDFTSETFLRALRRIGGITYQGRDIGAWFVTIARNIILDHRKSARARLEVTTGDVLEGDTTAPSPESSVLQALTSDRLIAAVKRLGDEQRECIVLRFVHGLSVSETAEIMGKNDGAIKALQHRAVRKLADLVGSELR